MLRDYLKSLGVEEDSYATPKIFALRLGFTKELDWALKGYEVGPFLCPLCKGKRKQICR